MDYVILRRAGGSLTLTIPKALAKSLGLSEGARMGVAAEGKRLIAEAAPDPKPAYTLEELLAQCDPDAPMSGDERDWLNAPAAGNEII